MRISQELYIAHLLGCAIQQTTPEEKPADLSWESIYDCCLRHSIANTIYPAVKKLSQQQKETALPDEFLKKWAETYQKAVVREITFDTARQEILAECEKAQIKYLPLKGILLKAYYPAAGMRKSADNDILFDPAKAKQMRNLMLRLGYQVKNFGAGNHDVYQKPPVLNFEMHRSLVSEKSPFYDYSSQVWERAVKDEENGYGYHMTKEDFYLHFLLHAYKHYSHGGTGIRTLCDQYLFLKKEQENLNWNYVNRQMKQMKLMEFDQEMRALEEALFGVESLEKIHLDEEQEQLYQELCVSGTYGTAKKMYIDRFRESRTEMDTSRKTKIRFLMQRIFPDISWVKTYYPVVRRMPWLYPFVLMFRILRGAIIKRKAIQSEAKTILNYKDS